MGIAVGILRIGVLCTGRDAGFGGNHISLVEQGRIRIAGMIISKSCQRVKSVHLSEGVEPVRQFAGILFFPGFDAHHLPQFPEEETVENDVHKHIVALVQLIHQFAQPADGERGFPLFAADFFFDTFQQTALHGAGFHELEQSGIRAENLQFLAVHGLHPGNLSGKGESGGDEECPDYSPYTCRQITGNDRQQTYTIDARNDYRQSAQEPVPAKYAGTCRPCFQLGFVGRLALMQQAEDAETLAEFQCGSQLADGCLPFLYLFFLFEMSPQPVGQQTFSRFGASAVDVLKQRMRTEYVQVVGIQMRRVGKLLAAVEAGCVIVQCGQFLPVDLYLFLQIVFAVEQTVMVFYQQDKRQKGDKRNPCQYRPAFRPETDKSCHSRDKQQQPQRADAVNLSLYFIQLLLRFVRNAAVG